MTGNSLEFLLGILLIFLGFVAVPLSWSDGDLPPDSIPRRASLGGSEGSSSSTSGGGVILVGPFPIFFGAWRNRGWRSFALAAAIGAVLFALVALYFLGLL